MKIKVLLVDDEKEFVDALAERLEIRDFEIAKAFDGDQAVEESARRAWTWSFWMS